MNFTVLHICGGYIVPSMFHSLFQEIDKLGVKQIVFVPLNSYNSEERRNHIVYSHSEGYSICSKKQLNVCYKLLYTKKIAHMVHEVETLIDLSSVHLIHAHLLGNEGAIAYELSKKYHIPYITAIRNTDLNAYFRVFKWKMPYFNMVFQNARKVICISNMYKEKVSRVFGNNEKIDVIPNGLDNYYLQHRYSKDSLGNPIKIVYTGGFQKNKNILSTYEAIANLRNKGYIIEFTAIGRNLPNHEDKRYAKRMEQLASASNWFHLKDAQNKEQLKDSLRQSDIFVMCSHHETFGLSYIEALSQGLPIVYTQGDGFDKMYIEGEVGFHANSKCVQDIENAILRVIQNYGKIAGNIAHLDMSKYAWSDIANKYFFIYKRIIDLENYEKD